MDGPQYTWPSWPPPNKGPSLDPPALNPLLVGPHLTAPSPLVLTSGGYRSRVGKRAVHILLECSLVFTTRKRSLGQGNVFTRVCHSVHDGGGRGWLSSMHHRSHDQHPGGWLTSMHHRSHDRGGICIRGEGVYLHGG